MKMPGPIASMLSSMRVPTSPEIRRTGLYIKESLDMAKASVESLKEKHDREIRVKDARIKHLEKALATMCQTSASYQRLWADSELKMLDSFDELVRHVGKSCPPEARDTITEILIRNDHERQRIMEDDRRNR